VGGRSHEDQLIELLHDNALCSNPLDERELMNARHLKGETFGWWSKNSQCNVRAKRLMVTATRGRGEVQLCGVANSLIGGSNQKLTQTSPHVLFLVLNHMIIERRGCFLR